MVYGIVTPTVAGLDSGFGTKSQEFRNLYYHYGLPDFNIVIPEIDIDSWIPTHHSQSFLWFIYGMVIATTRVTLKPFLTGKVRCPMAISDPGLCSGSRCPRLGTLGQVGTAPGPALVGG